MKKTVVIAIFSAVGLFAIIFWIAFIIVAFRNEYLVFDVKMKNDSNINGLYYEYDDIKYYGYDGLDDVDVYERRLIFNTNKRNMKDIIKNGDFYFLLNKMEVFRYNYGGVIESKYTSYQDDFCITKCDFFVEEEIIYIFSEKEYKNICRWYK